MVTVNGYTRGQDFGAASIVLDGLGDPDHPCNLLASGADYGDTSLFDIDLAEAIVAR